MNVPGDRPGSEEIDESRARASEVAASAAHPPQTDKVVFGVAAALVAAIVVWGLAATDNFGTVTGNILDWIVVEFGWLFVLTASGFVFFALWLAVSRYGRIPLGKDDEKPEFRTVSWISMMFAAGMGIGLMFFGVAEPLSHFVEPPPGSTGGTGVAMATSMFHWSLHPWAIYAVVGLAIAYGTFRRVASSSSARRSSRCWDAGPKVRSARSSTSSPCSRPCSAPRRRSAWARCRSARASRSPAGSRRPE